MRRAGTALQPAVLDIVDRAGLIEPFLNAGVHIKHSELMGPGMRPIMNADFGGVGCRYEFQCSQPQWRTEQILRDHLAARGVKVEYGVEVTAIDPGPETLRVTLDVGGRTEVATPHYLLGAGGAHDITRHSMNEHLVGETYGGRYVVADVKLGLAIPPETARVVVGAGGFVLFAPLPDNRWLIFVSRDPADARDDPPTAAELAAMVNARVGADVGLSDLRWVSYFKMHRREAEDLRRRPPVSARRRRPHVGVPLGGEGINAAFMDAADIAWKLALVVRGAAKPVVARELRDRTRHGGPPRARSVERHSRSYRRAGRRLSRRRRGRNSRRRPRMKSLRPRADGRCSTFPMPGARSSGWRERPSPRPNRAFAFPIASG